MKKAIQERPVWVPVLLGLLFTALIGVPGAKAVYMNHLFATESLPAQGTITGKGTREVQGRNARTIYWAGYSYEANGEDYRTQNEVAYSTWTALATGETVPIKYLADRPGYSRVDSEAERRDLRFADDARLAYGSIFFLIFAGLIGYGIRNNGIRNRLLTRGIATTGLVKSVALQARNRQRGTAINFSFSDNRGQTIVGQAWKVNNTIWKRSTKEAGWQEGYAIPVHYDSQNSSLFTVDLSAHG